MTLLLQDAEIQGLLTLATCIEAMERAFADFAHGVAANRPRVRYTCTAPNSDFDYFSNVFVGAVPSYNAAAVRIDSTRVQLRTTDGQQVSFVHVPQYQNRAWGLIHLYSLETAELLAILHDFTIEGIRVGATTGLAAKHLARPDAETVGLFGTGKHARTDLEGIALVRPIRRVKVYSPNPEHRERFAREMSAKLEIEVVAVDQPNAVVRGVDIVCCATNTNTPVFEGQWLEPGQLVTSIVNSDVVKHRTEIDESTFVRSDAICINDTESVHANRQIELSGPIDRGLYTWEKVRELGAVITGMKPGREHADDLVLYKNNTGMGIQFAAAGAIVYREALKQGVGRELPSEWFGTDMSEWYDKGYKPSP